MSLQSFINSSEQTPADRRQIARSDDKLLGSIVTFHRSLVRQVSDLSLDPSLNGHDSMMKKFQMAHKLHQRIDWDESTISSAATPLEEVELGVKRTKKFGSSIMLSSARPKNRESIWKGLSKNNRRDCVPQKPMCKRSLVCQ